MKFSKLKKTVALLVCLTCMLSAMPLNVFATEEDTTTDGVSVSTNNQETNLDQNEIDQGILDGMLLTKFEKDEIDKMSPEEKTTWCQDNFSDCFDTSGNIDHDAVENAMDTDENLKKGINEATNTIADSKQHTNNDSSSVAYYNLVKEFGKEKADQIYNSEEFQDFKICFNDINLESIPKDVIDEMRANGVEPDYIGKLDDTVITLMGAYGYENLVDFITDIQSGKYPPDSPLYQDWMEFKNSRGTAAESEVDNAIMNKYDIFPGINLSDFYDYTYIQGQVMELLGGGYTCQIDENGDLVFTSTVPGLESKVMTVTEAQLVTYYDAFLIEWRKLNPGVTPEPTKEEFLEAIKGKIIIETLESQTQYFYVDGDNIRELEYYMNEAYTYIKEVTFTLTRADGQPIKKQEVPEITAKEFKQKFLMLRDGDYSGQLISEVYLRNGEEEATFVNVFSNEQHRRRATAYLYAYFCLEEWLCQETGHPLKSGETYLDLKGWNIKGNKMTLTIDFYKSFRNIANITGINVNDIIRNYMSDYSKPQWVKDTSMNDVLKTSFTTHDGTLEGTYFGSGYFAKDEIPNAMGARDYDNITDDAYYSNTTQNINRTVSPQINNGDMGIGNTYYQNELYKKAYWGSGEGKYLGTVHSNTAFQKYFNNQKINTKMFKLGDNSTSTFGYVPFLVTNRPEISSAYNVQVDAIEYTLYMPAKASVPFSIGEGEDEVILNPSWIYFPHREVPAVYQGGYTTGYSTIPHWVYRDAIDIEHGGETNEFYKYYFKDDSYLLFHESIGGSTPTKTALGTMYSDLEKKNLRADMLQYFAGYAYRDVRKGNTWANNLGTFPGYTKKDMKDFLEAVALEDNFTEDCAEAKLLKKYNFKYATVTDPETGKIYCFAIFGAALSYKKGGEDPHGHSKCYMDDTDDDGVKDTLIHECYSDEYGCCDCAYCEYYYDETNQHKCSKGTGQDHLDDCCAYKTPEVSGGNMPTVTFNDTHGDVNPSPIGNSNGYASILQGVNDLGLGAVTGGIKSDHHRWAWPTTLEDIPDTDPDIDPNPDGTEPIPPNPIKPSTGGGNGGGGTTPDPYTVTPKPWPTPITPPNFLQLFDGKGIVIEDFISVNK